MILRRFIRHVQDQNWFAVALDFVIVVFGVFMGFQVQQWNQERGSESNFTNHAGGRAPTIKPR